MEVIDYSFDDIHVGQTASFDRTVSVMDVDTFADLSGDKNPLHTDDTYASTTQFKQRVVHGMLTASFFSTLVGMYLPGKRCLYLSQTLAFKQPVYLGDMVTVTGVVTAKSEVTKIITIQTTTKKGDVIVVEGEARVQMI